MRRNMIEGLNGWANTPTRRDQVMETIEHDDFRIELVGAALGVVAFVFEGRPNVLADACGVLRGGNRRSEGERGEQRERGGVCRH